MAPRIASPARWLRAPLLCALLGAAVWWLPKLPSLAEGQERAFLVDPGHFEVVSGPVWWTPSLTDAVGSVLGELPATPLRSDDEVAALLRAIEGATGWVRSIDRVEKRYPNQLEVAVTLREPVALVESDRGLLLVDGEGVVVSVAADAIDYLRTHDLPLVHASRPLRTATPGKRIQAGGQDAGVAEGLRVAAELAPHRATLVNRSLHLDVIDVTVKERTGGLALTDVEIYTRTGLPIEWGRSRGHPRLGALEPTVEAKVRGLVRVAARYPDLAGVRRIRLQFTEPAVVLEDDPHGGPHLGPRTAPGVAAR